MSVRKKLRYNSLQFVSNLKNSTKKILWPILASGVVIVFAILTVNIINKLQTDKHLAVVHELQVLNLAYRNYIAAGGKVFSLATHPSVVMDAMLAMEDSNGPILLEVAPATMEDTSGPVKLRFLGSRFEYKSQE